MRRLSAGEVVAGFEAISAEIIATGRARERRRRSNCLGWLRRVAAAVRCRHRVGMLRYGRVSRGTGRRLLAGEVVAGFEPIRAEIIAAGSSRGPSVGSVGRLSGADGAESQRCVAERMTAFAAVGRVRAVWRRIACARAAGEPSCVVGDRACCDQTRARGVRANQCGNHCGRLSAIEVNRQQRPLIGAGGAECTLASVVASRWSASTAGGATQRRRECRVGRRFLPDGCDRCGRSGAVASPAFEAISAKIIIGQAGR